MMKLIFALVVIACIALIGYSIYEAFKPSEGSLENDLENGEKAKSKIKDLNEKYNK